MRSPPLSRTTILVNEAVGIDLYQLAKESKTKFTYALLYEVGAEEMVLLLSDQLGNEWEAKLRGDEVGRFGLACLYECFTFVLMHWGIWR